LNKDDSVGGKSMVHSGPRVEASRVVLSCPAR